MTTSKTRFGEGEAGYFFQDSQLEYLLYTFLLLYWLLEALIWDGSLHRWKWDPSCEEDE